MKLSGNIAFVQKTFLLSILFFSSIIFAQNEINASQKSDFWKNVRFGGGFGLNIGSGYTDVTLSPGAIYNFNDYFSAGLGLQGSYVASKNNFNSYIYGASSILLFNPIEAIQLSAELEELRVNRTIKVNEQPDIKDNFWNTGLFLGLGYRTGNVIFGGRYNVLYSENDFVYSTAFMPFVRVYF